MDKNSLLFWQQDNRTIHKSEFSSNFFKNKKLKIIDWPARSPDLNPIENAFSYLSNKLYSKNKNYSNLDELWNSLSFEFKNIPIDYIQNLYCSMKRRLIEVI